MRLLRLLLVLLLLAGTGALQGGHCLTHAGSGSAPSAVVAVVTAAGHDHHGHNHDHADEHRHGAPRTGVTETVTDDCHLVAAEATPVTITGTVLPPPAGGVRVVVPAVAVAVAGPCPPRAVALTDIGVSRI
jgi:hypothetical protein